MAQPANLCPIFIAIAIHAAMIGVGASHMDPEDCKLQALLYLKVAGGFGLAMDILELIVQCCVGRDDDEDSRGSVCGLVGVIAAFAIAIWGSVVIFGPYSEWNYEDKEDPKFCEFTPFMFSFVVLILGWILIPLHVAILSCAVCAMCLS